MIYLKLNSHLFTFFLTLDFHNHETGFAKQKTNVSKIQMK